MKNSNRLHLAIILTFVLMIITAGLARAQENAVIDITPQKTVVTVTYDNADITKAIKLLVNEGVESRKISKITVFNRTYRVVPYVDGKITYVLDVDGVEFYESTRIADVRKHLIETINRKE